MIKHGVEWVDNGDQWYWTGRDLVLETRTVAVPAVDCGLDQFDVDVGLVPESFLCLVQSMGENLLFGFLSDHAEFGGF